MRPEKAGRLLNKGIQVYLNGGGVERIKQILPSLKKIHAKWVRLYGDPRTGEESYGYGEGDDCYWQMQYISDRWHCSFRLKWIIDGIENGAIERSRP